MAHASLFAGCSRPAAEAMECASRLGELQPEGLEFTFLGLRLVEPVLTRLAQANATPRMVEEVLALWVQEATGGGSGDAGSIFIERPTLQRLLFSAAMRASLRGATVMARCVFGNAIAAVLQHVRAEPGDVVKGDRHALRACLDAERYAGEDREEAMAAAARGQRTGPVGASRRAEHGFERAAYLVKAALAARRGEAVEVPPWAGKLLLSPCFSPIIY